MSFFKKAKAIGTMGAIGGLTGGLVGTVWGSNTPGANYETSSTIGTATGLAIGTAAGAIAMNPVKSAKVAGKVALGGAEIAGAGIIGAAEVAGAGIIGAAKIAAPVAAYGVGKTAANLAGAGNLLYKHAIKPDLKNESNLLGHKTTALGTGLIMGSAFIKGTQEAFQDFNRNRMGTSDGQITRATPRTPSYADNAGATGDLVFAMNRNRRG